MARRGELIVASVFAVLSLAVLIVSAGYSYPAKLFPLVASSFALALLIVVIVREQIGAGRAPDKEKTEEVSASWQRWLVITAWMVGIIPVVHVFGFVIGMPVYAFLALKVRAHRPWWLSVVTTLLVWAVLYFGFGLALKLYFPKGLLVEMIGQW